MEEGRRADRIRRAAGVAGEGEGDGEGGDDGREQEQRLGSSFGSGSVGGRPDVEERARSLRAKLLEAGSVVTEPDVRAVEAEVMALALEGDDLRKLRNEAEAELRRVAQALEEEEEDLRDEDGMAGGTTAAASLEAAAAMVASSTRHTMDDASGNGGGSSDRLDVVPGDPHAPSADGVLLLARRTRALRAALTDLETQSTAAREAWTEGQTAGFHPANRPANRLVPSGSGKGGLGPEGDDALVVPVAAAVGSFERWVEHSQAIEEEEQAAREQLSDVSRRIAALELAQDEALRRFRMMQRRGAHAAREASRRARGLDSTPGEEQE